MTKHKTPRSRASRLRRLYFRRAVLRPLNVFLLLAFLAGLAVVGWQEPQRRSEPGPIATIAVLEPSLPHPPIAPIQTTQPAPTALAPLVSAPALPTYEEPPALTVIEPVAPPVAALPSPHKPRIAIVIDDIGPDWRGSVATLKLPGPLTLALLPYAERVQELAARATAAGHELLVHMPMEPDDMATNYPGPIALLGQQSLHEQKAMLQRGLSAFSGYVGVNNHMGSRFTADPTGMAVMMAELAKRNLLFLDSRTTGHSAAPAAAAHYGIRFAGRDVFLDNERDVGKILAQLRQTERIARRHGQAIAIGHPHPETITALAQWLPQARRAGFELTTVSQLARVIEPTTSVSATSR